VHEQFENHCSSPSAFTDLHFCQPLHSLAGAPLKKHRLETEVFSPRL